MKQLIFRLLCLSVLNRDMLITNLDATITYDGMCSEVRDMCNLQLNQPITLKWIDNEGKKNQIHFEGDYCA